MAVSDRRLKKLGQLVDYAVAHDDPDPRGWRVESSDGRRLGRVADLIVNTESMQADYLDIEIDADIRQGSENSRRLVVPASAVRVGPEERREQRISIPRKANVVMLAVLRFPPSGALGVNDREWAAAGPDACQVRFARVPDDS